ncbi:MAG: hypothetical protein KatS3mg119_2484 [Rhodothalassiaceae bacterium]|nr:MAG: hypothetical protein KatS3mg119_2484 [Rhodothalassiaceae bacterium]
MYAVVRTGGKQYRVAPGDILKVEKLDGEAGQTILLQDVLMVADGETLTVGTPLVAGVAVKAEILEQARAPKIVVFKKKRRHNYRRKRGHRQHVTVLKVLEIGEEKALTGGAKKAKQTQEPAPAAAGTEKAPAKKTEAKKSPGGKTAAKKADAEKTAGDKKTAAKTAAKKTAAKKATPKKATAKAKAKDDE